MIALIKGITIYHDWKVVYSEWAPLGFSNPTFHTPNRRKLQGSSFWLIYVEGHYSDLTWE